MQAEIDLAGQDPPPSVDRSNTSHSYDYTVLVVLVDSSAAPAVSSTELEPSLEPDGAGAKFGA